MATLKNGSEPLSQEKTYRDFSDHAQSTFCLLCLCPGSSSCLFRVDQWERLSSPPLTGPFSLVILLLLPSPVPSPGSLTEDQYLEHVKSTGPPHACTASAFYLSAQPPPTPSGQSWRPLSRRSVNAVNSMYLRVFPYIIRSWGLWPTQWFQWQTKNLNIFLGGGGTVDCMSTGENTG